MGRFSRALPILVLAVVLAAALAGLAWSATNYTAGRVVAVSDASHVVMFDMKAGEGVEGMLFAMAPGLFPPAAADGMEYREEASGEDYAATFDPDDPALDGLAVGDLVRVRIDPEKGHEVVGILRKAGK